MILVESQAPGTARDPRAASTHRRRLRVVAHCPAGSCVDPRGDRAVRSATTRGDIA
jgi:hypothetical protein